MDCVLVGAVMSLTCDPGYSGSVENYSTCLWDSTSGLSDWLTPGQGFCESRWSYLLAKNDGSLDVYFSTDILLKYQKYQPLFCLMWACERFNLLPLQFQELFCDPIAEVVPMGGVVYSSSWSAEYKSYNDSLHYIGSSYQVECVKSYIPNDIKPVLCLKNHTSREAVPYWARTPTTCGKRKTVISVKSSQLRL